MARKGYDSEYRIKKEMEDIWGKGNCIKVAIGGANDYLIASCGELIKTIEVKETKSRYYYPKPREINQFKRIIEFAKQHKIDAELIVIFKRGKGKPVIKHKFFLYENGR